MRPFLRRRPAIRSFPWVAAAVLVPSSVSFSIPTLLPSYQIDEGASEEVGAAVQKAMQGLSLADYAFPVTATGTAFQAGFPNFEIGAYPASILRFDDASTVFRICGGK